MHLGTFGREVRVGKDALVVLAQVPGYTRRFRVFTVKGSSRVV